MAAHEPGLFPCPFPSWACNPPHTHTSWAFLSRTFLSIRYQYKNRRCCEEHSLPSSSHLSRLCPCLCLFPFLSCPCLFPWPPNTRRFGFAEWKKRTVRASRLALTLALGLWVVGPAFSFSLSFALKRQIQESHVIMAHTFEEPPVSFRRCAFHLGRGRCWPVLVVIVGLARYVCR